MRSASEAYVFAYPLVLSAHALHAPNRLFVSPGPADTLRLTGWLDLGREPHVLSMANTFGRYYVVWLRDAWHTAFASVGARTTGTGAHDFAVLGPGAHGVHLAPGLHALAAPTPIVRVSGCFEAAGASAAELARGIRLCPLSRWHELGDGVPAALSDGTPPDPVDEVERLDAHSFFSTAREPCDDPDLEAGARRGLAAIRATPTVEAVGSWRISYDLGKYGTDYLRRAAAARAGLEPATDELHADTDTDAEGRPLTGRDRYLLRFPADGEPPVNGFWSLSTEAGSTGDRAGLTLDPDGSLTIRIQHDEPTEAANWLPAPAGRFNLALRLYWPREEALGGQWLPPAVTLVSPAR
jgi:hypothetical protein